MFDARLRSTMFLTDVCCVNLYAPLVLGRDAPMPGKPLAFHEFLEGTEADI